MSAITASPVGITSDVVPAAIERIRAAFAVFGGSIAPVEAAAMIVADTELRFAGPRRRRALVERAAIGQHA